MLTGGIADSRGKRRNAVAYALLGEPGKIAFNTGNPIIDLPVVSDCPTENAT
jgi:hypothetical protein